MPRSTLLWLRSAVLAVILMVVAVTPFYSSAAANQSASTARTMSLHEVGRLHLASRRGGNNLHEMGTQSGTLGGTMDVRIVTAYTTASIKFSVNPGGGSFHGEGVVAYYVAGNTAHFNGGVKITGGTGRFTHISASKMQINGWMQRSNYAATMTIAGTVSL